MFLYLPEKFVFSPDPDRHPVNAVESLKESIYTKDLRGDMEAVLMVDEPQAEAILKEAGRKLVDLWISRWPGLAYRDFELVVRVTDFRGTCRGWVPGGRPLTIRLS